MKKTTLFFCFVIAGCSTSSGVLKAGPDTFTVSTAASPGAGGGAAAKKSAYELANQECAKEGRVIHTISEQAKSPSWTDGMHAIDLVFKCSQA